MSELLVRRKLSSHLYLSCYIEVTNSYVRNRTRVCTAIDVEALSRRSGLPWNSCSLYLEVQLCREYDRKLLP